MKIGKKKIHVSHLSSEELHRPDAANPTSLAQKKSFVAQSFAWKSRSTKFSLHIPFFAIFIILCFAAIRVSYAYMCMENCLPFDNALATDLLGEAFSRMSLGIRYAGNSLSVSDAQMEGKCSSWMLSNSTASGKTTDRKVGTQFFWGLWRKSQSASPAAFSDILSCINSTQTLLGP